MLLEYPPKIMKPRIDFHCPDHSGIDALLFFLFFGGWSGTGGMRDPFCSDEHCAKCTGP